MSTPSTATATLPPYHGGYPFSHQTYAANPSPYRPTLPTASRLGQSFHYSVASSNGVSLSSASSSASSTARPALEAPGLTPRTEQSQSALPPTMFPDDETQNRKRRRSRGPDWNKFYQNGLPKEIIVIDDTPEPQQFATPPSNTAAAGETPNGIVKGLSGGEAGGTPRDGSSGRHLAKKRKRDEDTSRYDPVHGRVAGSNSNDTPTGSTISSDRTNSAIHTTAATSLGSLSSNGQYDYEAQPGQKRKRTTRQQIANEAKRREVGILGPAYTSYQPPPHPPKKASEVPVRVVHDVRHGPSLYCLAASLTYSPRTLRRV